jgi:hypothetical protein
MNLGSLIIINSLSFGSAYRLNKYPSLFFLSIIVELYNILSIKGFLIFSTAS